MERSVDLNELLKIDEALELKKKLHYICDDDFFVENVMSNLETMEDIELWSRIIEEEKEITSSRVILIDMAISGKRNGYNLDPICQPPSHKMQEELKEISRKYLNCEWKPTATYCRELYGEDGMQTPDFLK